MRVVVQGKDLAVGDVWDDGTGLRSILAVYDRDMLVEWEPHDPAASRDMLILPKRLFAEGRCGRRVLTAEQ
jgi:hypothetical protein